MSLSTSKTKNAFEINKFFNDTPFKILGTHDFPMFYAREIAEILGIKQYRQMLTKLSTKCIVTPDQKKKYNIIPVREDGVPKFDIVLLTEYGVYTWLILSRTEIAQQFRDFFFDVMNSLRTKGEYIVQSELEQLRAKQKYTEKENQELKSLKSNLVNMCDKIYVYSIPVDKQVIDQRDALHSDDEYDETDSDYEEVDNDRNTIDNYNLFRQNHPEIALDHEQCYKLSTSRTYKDLQKYTIQYEIYCRNSQELLNNVDKVLYSYKIGKSSLNIYRCDLKKIISILQSCVITKTESKELI